MLHKSSRRITMLILIIGAIVGMASVALAEENCGNCHGNEAREQLESSIHQSLACVSCHEGYDSYPHPSIEVNSVNPCSTCHSEIVEDYEQSVHGEMGHGCSRCHESPHTIKKTTDPLSQVERLHEPETCGVCHKNSLPYESYRDSVHGIGNYLGSETMATCSDCHTSHEIVTYSDPRSSVNEENVADTCAVCHGISAPGFAQGKEHYEISPTGYGAPMFWVMKMFTWLTIVTITLLVVHMELELYRRLRYARKREGRK